MYRMQTSDAARQSRGTPEVEGVWQYRDCKDQILCLRGIGGVLYRRWNPMIGRERRRSS
jgi:hypothetical protein